MHDSKAMKRFYYLKYIYQMSNKTTQVLNKTKQTNKTSQNIILKNRKFKQISMNTDNSWRIEKIKSNLIFLTFIEIYFTLKISK